MGNWLNTYGKTEKAKRKTEVTNTRSSYQLEGWEGREEVGVNRTWELGGVVLQSRAQTTRTAQLVLLPKKLRKEAPRGHGLDLCGRQVGRHFLTDTSVSEEVQWCCFWRVKRSWRQEPTATARWRIMAGAARALFPLLRPLVFPAPSIGGIW